MKRVFLVRHAQAEHNVDQRYHLRDPPLTELGQRQARTLRDRLTVRPDVVIASPLIRTLQTALIGITGGTDVPLVSLAELQETSTEPCDTGSPKSTLLAREEFQGIVDFSDLPDDWDSKQGKWAYSDKALTARAADARGYLLSRPESVIVAVTHGGFLHYLTEDFSGKGDFNGTGWYNSEFREYTMGPDAHLIETTDSREQRTKTKLSPEEQHQFAALEITG